MLELLGASLGGGPAGRRPPEFFRWKHLENPFGRSFMLLAERDGRLVGLRAFMRWRFEAGRAPGAAPSARSTRRRIQTTRAQGIFTRLTLAALDRSADEDRPRVQHAERQEPARLPEDGLAERRGRADSGARSPTRPVRGPGPVEETAADSYQTGAGGVGAARGGRAGRRRAVARLLAVPPRRPTGLATRRDAGTCGGGTRTRRCSTTGR